MAKTNTAATTEATTEATKAPSKMALARALRAEIYAAGYDLDGKSQRQVFIARAQAEIGMTEAGANTYFQNLSNEAAGRGLYRYNVSEKKPGAADPEANLPGQQKAPTKAEVKDLEKKVVDLSKRYLVQDKRKRPVNSFGTMKAAQAFAAATEGLTAVDTKAS